VEGTSTFFVRVRYEDSWDLDTFSNILKMSLTKRHNDKIIITF